MNDKDSLWARVIRTKYNNGQDLIYIIRAKKRGSRVWAGIIGMRLRLSTGMRSIKLDGSLRGVRCSLSDQHI